MGCLRAAARSAVRSANRPLLRPTWRFVRREARGSRLPSQKGERSEVSSSSQQNQRFPAERRNALQRRSVVADPTSPSSSPPQSPLVPRLLPNRLDPSPAPASRAVVTSPEDTSSRKPREPVREHDAGAGCQPIPRGPLPFRPVAKRPPTEIQRI